jgi:glucuronokinase
MKSLTETAYARAGLLGNPSDGYNGKTISLIVKNYSARVTLNPSDRVSFVPTESDSHEYDSITHLTESIESHGYYGGIRLLKAATKRFTEYCKIVGHDLSGHPNFAMQFASDIPRQVGLAGSSAIVTAAIRGLAKWHDVEIAPHLLASLTLSAETELGIPAGLQDRVIQAYQGLVYMDFSSAKMQTEHDLTFGHYEQMDPSLLSNLYIAFATNAGEPTEVLHNDLRKRYVNRDEQVLAAMGQFASYAEQAKSVIEANDLSTLSTLVDANYDLRESICQLHVEHKQMIETARNCGASAKYCGSGGAIIGVYSNDQVFAELERQLGLLDCTVIKPTIQ